MQSQIQRPDRLEKLILIMAIAMFWAVSCGLAEDAAINYPAASSGVFTDQLAHPQSLRRKAAGNVPENGFNPNPASKKRPLPLLAVQTRLAVLQKELRLGPQASKALGTVEFMRDGKVSTLTTLQFQEGLSFHPSISPRDMGSAGPRRYIGAGNAALI